MVWRAEIALEENGGRLADALKAPCPVALDDLLAGAFDFRAVARRIAATEC